MNRQSARSYGILVVAIVLLGVNMRAPIVSFGSVAAMVQADLGLSALMVGVLGAIPMLAFSLGSIIAPKVSERFGLEKSLMGIACLLTVAIVGRVVGGVASFVLGTIAVALAIALGNVLIPAVIKKRAKERLSTTTGIYAMSLSLFAGVAAGVVVPLAYYLDSWRLSLSLWALASFVVVWLWLWLYRISLAQGSNNQGSNNQGNNNPINHHQVNHATPPSSTDTSKSSVWRSSLAWWISGLMGLQSLLYYTLASFLGLLLVSRGVSPVAAGQVMMVLQCTAIPTALFLARWVAMGKSIRIAAMTASIISMIGMAGLAFLPTAWVWLMAVLVGSGLSLVFTLCLMLFGLKTHNDKQTAQLAGMVQAVGYGLAFFGPVMVGLLLSWSGGFTLPMGVLLALLVLQGVCAWFATSNRTI